MRIQHLKARVGASAYTVDIDAVAMAIVDRLAARADALAAGRAALDLPPRARSSRVLKAR
jgi:hypothetical protein